MRLYGKIHDYYDTALSYGHDETLHFTRETVTFADTWNDRSFKTNAHLAKFAELIDPYARDPYRYQRFYAYPYNISQYPVCVFVVGFCGKLYPGLTFGGKFYYPPNYSGLKESIIDNHYYTNDRNFFDSQPKGRAEFDKLKKTIDFLSGLDILQYFIDNKVPYFVYTVNSRNHRTLHHIPVLKDYDFQKVIDPYTAMQELSMFLGGVIPRQVPELIQVADKDRIAQHGFNKQSFRHPVKLKDLYSEK
jgi:hypothetical protein